MTVWLSYDEHRSWPVRKLIHSGPAFYSNMARSADGTVVLIYGRDGAHRSNPARNMIARFNLEWLTEGRDALGTGPKPVSPERDSGALRR